jgi:hypothetical protein
MTTTSTRPGRTRGLATWRDRFNRHHDHVSVARQRVIANLVCVVDVGLVALYFVAVEAWGWHLSIPPTALAVALVLFALSFVAMLASSGLPIGFIRWVRGLGEAPTPGEEEEPRWLATSRKYLFYPAAYGNFVAVAIWIEVSGGLVHSPFTPVLFAMILTAQQLSRFKLNSWLFIGFGLVATVALALFERAFGVREEPEAPVQLAFYILALAFLITALCTHAAKATNYRASGRFPLPTHAELYGTPDGRWRFSLYCGGTRLDPILECDHEPHTMEEAQEQVKALALELCGTERTGIVWRTSYRGDEAVGTLR